MSATPERILIRNRAKHKRWRDRNVETERARSQKYYRDNLECERLRLQRYRQSHPEIIKAQYLRRDRAKLAESKRKYRSRPEVRERIRIYKRAYDARRKASDPSYRFKELIRVRILRALREQYGMKAARTMSLLGCSIASLRMYLESRFKSGMSWENHGTTWQIDHIMPCAIFDLTKPEHQKRCFHFSNLQPLWTLANQTKHAKATPEQREAVRI